MTEQRTSHISTAGVALGMLLLTLIAYVGSFVYLSHYGNPDPSPFSTTGYYFASPMSPEGEERHLLLCRVYWPLIEADYHLVTGRRPGATLTQMLSCVDDDDDWPVAP